MMDPIFPDFPKASPVPRGCGVREPGGVYAESGLSDQGIPLEAFLLDPPLPMPNGLDLAKKPQLWQRSLPSGEPLLDSDGLPIYDVLIWVGAKFYPYCPDFIEEVRRYGASRRLNPNLDLSLLSQASRMILVHPRVINTKWQDQRPPQECDKNVPGHDGQPAENAEDEDAWGADEWEKAGADGETAESVLARVYDHTSEQTEAIVVSHAHVPTRLSTPSQVTHSGPCLFKLWELIPVDAAQTTIDIGGEDLPLCLRAIGSTTYQYRPTGEAASSLTPGLFAALPITGFALIQFVDGSVNEKAKKSILMGLETYGRRAVPFYESDR